jgi:hypothetical protein
MRRRLRGWLRRRRVPVRESQVSSPPTEVPIAPPAQTPPPAPVEAPPAPGGDEIRTTPAGWPKISPVSPVPRVLWIAAAAAAGYISGQVGAQLRMRNLATEMEEASSPNRRLNWTIFATGFGISIGAGVTVTAAFSLIPEDLRNEIFGRIRDPLEEPFGQLVDLLELAFLRISIRHRSPEELEKARRRATASAVKRAAARPQHKV